jgi:hypothetical protein
MDETAKGTVTRDDYVAYLLRLWREGTDGVTWRGSLQSPHGGEQVGFGRVDELFDFLQRQIDAAGKTAGEES